MRFLTAAALAMTLCLQGIGTAFSAEEPDLIFKKSTVWKFTDTGSQTGNLCH